ncbi:hypothetical protein ACMZ4Y_04140 [Prevotella histicola]
MKVAVSEDRLPTVNLSIRTLIDNIYVETRSLCWEEREGWGYDVIRICLQITVRICVFIANV